MSRNSEALKRASTGLVDSLERQPADASDRMLLDEYPCESAYPRERAPESSLVSGGHPSAPTNLVPQRPVPYESRAAVLQDPKLVGSPTANPLLVEQYRRFGGVVHELQLERGLKSFTVTSAIPKEGKTLTVANLGLTLSESYGRRVLLIDADLRRPSLHSVLGVPNRLGLSDALKANGSPWPLLSITPSLTLLAAGSPEPNPVAAITSERMMVLLDEAYKRFDWVILDAPPVAVMPDAALLAGITGAIVLVIAAGSTPYPQVARAIAQLGRECIVGTVLNKVQEKAIPDTSMYRDYYSVPREAE